MTTKTRPGSKLRTFEAAAIAGLAHTVLSLLATASFMRPPSVADDPVAALEWYGDTSNQRSMIAGLNLLVMGSIAFIWFVAVIRRRVGDRENRFFGSVFFGSSLVLVGTWLVAGLLIVTPALSAHSYGTTPELGEIANFRAAGIAMSSVIATRLEAVFIISSTTVARLSGAFPRLIILVGYITGLALLLVPLPNQWMTWVFPIWVGMVSIFMLVRRQQMDSIETSEGAA